MKKETINQVNYRTDARKMQVKFDEFYGEKIIPASDSTNGHVYMHGRTGICRLKRHEGKKLREMRSMSAAISEYL